MDRFIQHGLNDICKRTSADYILYNSSRLVKIEFKHLNNHYGKSVVHNCCYSRDRLGDRLSWLSCGKYHSHIVGYCRRSCVVEGYSGFC